jgi:glycosyltransferase involved in cell wall biosynthesis
MTDVSIVIPFRDAAATLPACLESLLRLEFESFELILVDNGSADESAAIAAKFIREHGGRISARLLREETPGASAARNRGAQAAAGKYLAFTDADCVVSAGWLSETSAAFTAPSIGAVAGSMGGFTPRGAVEGFHCLFTLPGCPKDQTFTEYRLNSGGFPTANLLVRAEVFRGVGGFDPTIPIYGEDHDLCARIYQAGYAIKWISKGIVQHLHRHSLSGTWGQAFKFGYSHALLLAKHFPRLFLVEFGSWALRSVRLPVRLWVDFSSADKKLLGLLLAAAVYWPCILLIPAYFLYLTVLVARRAKARGLATRITDHLIMAAVLIVKSAGMTAGRLHGSMRRRVLCV